MMQYWVHVWPGPSAALQITGAFYRGIVGHFIENKCVIYHVPIYLLHPEPTKYGTPKTPWGRVIIAAF